MDCPLQQPNIHIIHHPLQPFPIPHPSTPPSQRPLHNIITISGTGTESFLIPHGPGARRRPTPPIVEPPFLFHSPPIFHIPLSLARTSTFVSHKQHSTHLCRSLSSFPPVCTTTTRPVPSDRHPSSPHPLLPHSSLTPPNRVPCKEPLRILSLSAPRPLARVRCITSLCNRCSTDGVRERGRKEGRKIRMRP